MKKSIFLILLLSLVLLPGCGGSDSTESEPAEDPSPAASVSAPLPPDPIDIIIDPSANPTTGWTLGPQDVTSNSSLEGTNTLSPLVIGKSVTGWVIDFQDGTSANVTSVSVLFSGGTIDMTMDASNILQWSIGGTAQTAYSSTTLGDYAWPANLLLPSATTSTNPPLAANFTYVSADGQTHIVAVTTFKQMTVTIQ